MDPSLLYTSNVHSATLMRHGQSIGHSRIFQAESHQGEFLFSHAARYCLYRSSQLHSTPSCDLYVPRCLRLRGQLSKGLNSVTVRPSLRITETQNLNVRQTVLTAMMTKMMTTLENSPITIGSSSSLTCNSQFGPLKWTNCGLTSKSATGDRGRQTNHTRDRTRNVVLDENHPNCY